MCPLIVVCFVLISIPPAILHYTTFWSNSGDFPDFVQTVHPRIYEKTIRRRRDISASVYINEPSKLKMIELGDWTLQLNPESNLIVAPNLEAEWVAGNGEVTPKALRRCDYKFGVVSSLATSSRVAVALCGPQITGFISAGAFLFFIQPTNGTDGDHLLYSKNRLKRDLQPPAQWLFNLTGDVIDIEGDIDSVGDNTDEKNPKSSRSEERIRNHLDWRREQFLQDEELGYFYDTAWTAEAPRTRTHGGSVLPSRWVEIALAVDHTLISFHGKGKVEQYVLALMNIVNAVYQDSSLEANIHLVVSRLLLFEHKNRSVVRPGDAKRSLENVNSWNNRLHVSLAPGEPHHDVAVWLTRSDIGGPSGYAPVAGVCDPKRSCALNRDEGLTSAFIIAHEMAHVLGLHHDGDKKNANHCDKEATKGSIMAPLVAATFHQFFWSECSRDEFKKIVKKWSCLSNSPVRGEIVLNATLQNAFSMDEQCRMEFGDGFSLCRAFEISEPCSHLWCGHQNSPQVCKTKKGSPLEGTECGFNKWCRNGYCEDIDINTAGHVPVMLNPQDGGWGGWSPWGSCSKSCGTGVQFRTRKCNNPEPSYGGNGCEGVSEKWRICNSNPCPEPLGDMRAQQCKRLPKLLDIVGTREGNMTWLPYESGQLEKKCKLICISEGTKELFESTENLIDGTPCSYDENSDNICIQGVCHFIGCDGQLFSKMKTDVCGVCGGNNSDCSNIESIFRRRLKREVSRVAVLPRMATRIKLEANVSVSSKGDPSVAFILKNRKKKKYTITIPNAGLHSDIIEGTKFYYEKTKYKHKIWANGPVLAETVILVYAPISEIEEGLNISLRSEYIIYKNVSASSTRFRWITGGWGPCSASCGGGRRQKTVACWDYEEQKLVRRKHCSLITKPSVIWEKCNTFECHFQWVPGKWEPCSKTCGLSGIQFREVYCIPKSVLNRIQLENNQTAVDQPWMYMVNPHRCSGITPLNVRPCNRIPCTSFWTYGEWSQCSESCGKGLSHRSSYCPPPEGETFYSCGEAPPHTQKRVCQDWNMWSHPDCRKRRKKLCVEDKSDSCSLSVLWKYCKVGEFRKICCKSCFGFS